MAGVFVNRLRKGMRLQSDPTIIYGIVGGQGSLGRPIYRTDIKKKTPYNTYQIDGLPPTPICNPGRAALKAVLNPEPTDALYFVADGTGGHTFSATLKQHNAAVANWRKIEKAAREKAKLEPKRPAISTSSGVEQVGGESESNDVVVATPKRQAEVGGVGSSSDGAAGVVTTLNVSAAETGSVESAPTLGDAGGVIDVGSVPLPIRKPK